MNLSVIVYHCHLYIRRFQEILVYNNTYRFHNVTLHSWLLPYFCVSCVHICACFVFDQEMCYSADFANVKIDVRISWLAELLIFPLISKGTITLSFGYPKFCNSSISSKLVLDLQIKVSDSQNCCWLAKYLKS